MGRSISDVRAAHAAGCLLSPVARAGTPRHISGVSVSAGFLGGLLPTATDGCIGKFREWQPEYARRNIPTVALANSESAS
jgi:hypothetical protein